LYSGIQSFNENSSNTNETSDNRALNNEIESNYVEERNWYAIDPSELLADAAISSESELEDEL
jgi:hypothetical protein